MYSATLLNCALFKRLSQEIFTLIYGFKKAAPGIYKILVLFKLDENSSNVETPNCPYRYIFIDTEATTPQCCSTRELLEHYLLSILTGPTIQKLSVSLPIKVLHVALTCEND